MRIPVVMLALSLAFPVSAAAQAQTHAPAQAERPTFLPQHKTRLSVDFGIKKALKNLPQLPVRCDAIKKHRPAGFIELPVYGGHHVRNAPVTPCPVR